jgi:hypothetical protein
MSGTNQTKIGFLVKNGKYDGILLKMLKILIQSVEHTCSAESTIINLSSAVTCRLPAGNT